MKSQLNGKNKIKAANTWAVSLMKYGAGTIKWNKEELQEIDRKPRKIVTMNKELHPRSDVARIYVPREKGGRGLISFESCVGREEINLSWYVRNSDTRHYSGKLEIVMRLTSQRLWTQRSTK